MGNTPELKSVIPPIQEAGQSPESPFLLSLEAENVLNTPKKSLNKRKFKTGPFRSNAYIQAKPSDIDDLEISAGYFKLFQDPTAEEQKPLAISDERYAEMVREVFGLSFREENSTLNELKPYRVRVCWRIVREMGRIRGLVPGDHFLMEGLQPTWDNEDPWVHPEPFELDSGRRQMTRSDGMVSDPIQLLKKFWNSQHLDDSYYPNYCQMQPDKEIAKGFAFLPPDIPRRYIDTFGNVSGLYSPENDPLLRIFIEIIQEITHRLRIRQGSIDDRQQGLYGVLGLDDPWLIRTAFPSRDDLMIWERIVVEETLIVLIRDGAVKTREHLFKKYGLMPHETSSMIKLAKTWLRMMDDCDIEDEKHLMIARLDDLASRAKEVCDIRSELRALQSQQQVIGLTRTEVNEEEDLINVVKRVAGERKREKIKQIENTTTALEEGDE